MTETPPIPPLPVTADAAEQRGVSVVIPAWNEEATIVRCLEALELQSIAPLEVLVVDNRSTDATVQRARAFSSKRFPVRILNQDREQGLIPTRNFGFAAARGAVYARIDADTVVAPDWVEHLAAGFDAREVGALSGPVGYYDMPWPRFWERVDAASRRVLVAFSRDRPFLYGSNMALRAEAWERIEGEACPDHEDAFHEDIDLAIHLAEAGFCVDYAPKMRVSISARRLNSTRAAFNDYTRRFDRTFGAHDLTHPPLRVLAAALRFAFPLLRGIHRSGASKRELLVPRVDNSAPKAFDPVVEA